MYPPAAVWCAVVGALACSGDLCAVMGVLQLTLAIYHAPASFPKYQQNPEAALG